MTKRLLLAALAISISYCSSAQWEQVGPADGYTPGTSIDQKILIHPATGEIYVAMIEMDFNFYGLSQITVVRYTGSDWEYVGERMFSRLTTPSQFDGILGHGLNFRINPVDGNPYVSFARQQYESEDGGSVMYFNGGEWVQLGDLVIQQTFDGFLGDGKDYMMSINPVNGQPAIIYQDPNLGGASCLGWDSDTWSQLDLLGFTGSASVFHAIEHGPGGELYIMHNGTGSGDNSIMQFNGSVFETLGELSFSPGFPSSRDNCIRVSTATGEVYAATKNLNGANGATITVKKYNGSSWELVGEDQESQIISLFPSNGSFAFKLHPLTGEPYLLYGDGLNSNAPTLRRFDGTDWVIVGTTPVEFGIHDGLDFSIDPGNGDIYAIVRNSTMQENMYKFIGTINSVGESTEGDWSFGPNPASDRIQIYGLDQIEYVELWDLQGRLVLKVQGPVVNISELGTGIYEMRIVDRERGYLQARVRVN